MTQIDDNEYNTTIDYARLHAERDYYRRRWIARGISYRRGWPHSMIDTLKKAQEQDA